MIEDGTHVLANRTPWSKEIQILICEVNTLNKRVVRYAEPITLKRRENEAESMRPTLSISETSAQRLMDELWDCGLRPTEGSGSAGAMAATQKHLEDMRTLVFKKEVQ